MAHKAYPSDVSDEEWALVAPFLTLMTAGAQPARGLSWLALDRTGWCSVAHDAA